MNWIKNMPYNKNSNVLITGANGFIGTELCKQLTLHKLNFVGIDRAIKFDDYEADNEIIIDLCDMDNSTAKYIFNFDGVVIHLAAARTDDATFDIYQRDNIKATQALLKNLDPNKIRGFIHISSVASLDGLKLKQTQKKFNQPDDYYRSTKYEQQKLIQDWCELNNVNIIILSPSAVYDKTFRSDTNIGRLIRISNKIRIVPKIETKKTLTPMPLLMEALLSSLKKLLDNKNPQIRIFELYYVIEQPIRDVSQIVQDLSRITIINFKIPGLKFILLSIAFMISLFDILKKSPLTISRVQKLFRDTTYNNFKGKKIWGISDE